MIRYADLWAVQSLRERCEEFLVEEYPLIKADFHCALTIASMVIQHNFSAKAVENAVSRLAYFGTETLIQANVFDMVNTIAFFFFFFFDYIHRTCNDEKFHVQ